ncbi:MAG: hypothetical protein VXW46_07340 [Pseudomonadota bacterium]|nr:hypothetical protein [Pseudomonadota bacterium]
MVLRHLADDRASPNKLSNVELLAILLAAGSECRNGARYEHRE